DAACQGKRKRPDFRLDTNQRRTDPETLVMAGEEWRPRRKQLLASGQSPSVKNHPVARSKQYLNQLAKLRRLEREKVAEQKVTLALLKELRADLPQVKKHARKSRLKKPQSES